MKPRWRLNLLFIIFLLFFKGFVFFRQWIPLSIQRKISDDSSKFLQFHQEFIQIHSESSKFQKNQYIHIHPDASRFQSQRTQKEDQIKEDCWFWETMVFFTVSIYGNLLHFSVQISMHSISVEEEELLGISESSSSSSIQAEWWTPDGEHSMGVAMMSILNDWAGKEWNWWQPPPPPPPPLPRVCLTFLWRCTHS